MPENNGRRAPDRVRKPEAKYNYLKNTIEKTVSGELIKELIGIHNNTNDLYRKLLENYILEQQDKDNLENRNEITYGIRYNQSQIHEYLHSDTEVFKRFLGTVIQADQFSIFNANRKKQDKLVTDVENTISDIKKIL